MNLMDLRQYRHKIFTESATAFDQLALDAFRFQYEHVPVYHEFVNALSVNVPDVNKVHQIPFLPIRFFKSLPVHVRGEEPIVVFESSGTTGTVTSRHYISDPGIYEESFLAGFQRFYGNIKGWCIVGLLPSYLERSNSSLVYMVDSLIKKSAHAKSGFYLHDHASLHSLIRELEAEQQPTLLIGVTFALLDFAEKFNIPLHHTIIMETGGMKGRREEMVRQEVHDRLRQSFGPIAIHSEYGMTELLSQAYSKGDGLFECPPWMKILIRVDDDPLDVKAVNDSAAPSLRGAINIIDLANIHSCCFIATDDAGKLHPDGRFEVLGRMDNSDLRGCSLLTV